MLIGLPTETKPSESRVALTPAGVDTLIHEGHRMLVQAGAGEQSGFPDARYQRVGATIVPTAADAWSAELVVKVKEPQPAEYPFFRPGLILAYNPTLKGGVNTLGGEVAHPAVAAASVLWSHKGQQAARGVDEHRIELGISNPGPTEAR